MHTVTVLSTRSAIWVNQPLNSVLRRLDCWWLGCRRNSMFIIMRMNGWA